MQYDARVSIYIDRREGGEQIDGLDLDFAGPVEADSLAAAVRKVAAGVEEKVKERLGNG